MANPTPGPWTRDPKSPMLLRSPDGLRVLTVGFSGSAQWPDEDEAEANMVRLLAALDALTQQEAE